MNSLVNRNKPGKLYRLIKNIRKDKYLLLLMLPTVVFFIIFHYYPMYGVVIAFKNFSISRGIIGSPWAGFKWFEQFFKSIFFFRLLTNTFLLSFYSLIAGFSIPIIFALLVNEVRGRIIRRVVQSISYFPYFISVVVVVGIIINFVSIRNGIINNVLRDLGKEPINFLSDPKWFRPLYIISGIWQTFGFSSIIYLGAVSSIDPQLYEAATVDGAGRLKQIWHITFPGIIPIAVTMLILALGGLLNVGFEKIILLYNPSTYITADVISTYVYRRGIVNAEFSFGAAVGLFNSVIGFILIFSVNAISKKFIGVRLW